MSDLPPLLDPPPKNRRRWVSVLLPVVLILGLGLTYLVVDGLWTGTDAHLRHARRRIDEHYRAAMDTFPGQNSTDRMSQAERGRYEIIRAVGTAMGNWPFYYRQNCVPEKVEAIANRLDADQGDDFKTFAGCCQILVMCDEASWQFNDYPWIQQLREMEADGTIPKLPVLGKRWENDPRYLAYKASQK